MELVSFFFSIIIILNFFFGINDDEEKRDGPTVGSLMPWPLRSRGDSMGLAGRFTRYRLLVGWLVGSERGRGCEIFISC